MKKLYSAIAQIFFFFLIAFQIAIAQEKTNETSNTEDPKIEVKIIKAQKPRPEPIILKNELSQSNGNEGSQRSFADKGTRALNGSKPTTSVGVGNTPAQLSVSLTGAATYSVPFALPPGIKNVMPKLGLTFNSQGGNGLAGWGWNVSGLSSITRISSTKFHDGVIDPVDGDGLDRFALDGQRLILVSGTYGWGGSIYTTENKSNIKLILWGGYNGHPASYFDVYYPDGSFARYGYQNSVSSVEWAIRNWRDAKGNYILYDYSLRGGLLRISKISYGARGQATSPNTINFHYKTRNRFELALMNNTELLRSSILQKVEIKGKGGHLYRKYELYHDKTWLGYDRVRHIQEFNGAGEAMPAISFNYQGSPYYYGILYFGAITITPSFDRDKDAIVPGDFNKDGHIDFIKYDRDKKDKIYMFNGLFNGADIGREINTGSFLDVFPSTILGKSETVANTDVQLELKDPISYNTSYNAIDIYAHNVISSKANVDYTATRQLTLSPGFHAQQGTQFKARIDPSIKFTKNSNPLLNHKAITVVKKIGADNDYKIRFRNYINIEKNNDYYDREWLSPRHTYKFYKKKCILFNCSWNYEGYKTKVIPQKFVSGDFNGDGLTDVLAISLHYKICTHQGRKDCYGDDYNPKDVYFIDLDRRKASNSNHSGELKTYIHENDRLLTGDFNGDGKTDLFHFTDGTFYVYELNAKKQLVLLVKQSDNRINPKRPILLGDYNGDGKTDVLMPDSDKTNYWRFFYSMGGSFRALTQWNDVYYSDNYYLKDKNTRNHYVAQDINGDGKTDLIYQTTKKGQYAVIEVLTNATANRYGYATFKKTVSERSFSIKEFGRPIFLNVDKRNENLEYAYISGNNIHPVQFVYDHRKDVMLSWIHNNGISQHIDYKKLESGSGVSSVNGTYYAYYHLPGGKKEFYPYIDINMAPSMKMVSKITETADGITRYQDFAYKGAVSNAEGLGFIGFKWIARSNTYGKNVSKIWSISKHDPQKRGAVSEQWTKLYRYGNPFAYSGGDFIQKTKYTYRTQLLSNKVFINVPTQVVINDRLQGITTTKRFEYDQYYNVTKSSTSFPGGSNIVEAQYSNNPSVGSSYYIGRPTYKKETSVLGGERFSTETQYAYSGALLTSKKSKAMGSDWLTEAYGYDAYGNMTRRTISGNGIASRSESFQYSSDGRFLTESTDTEGLTTRFTYDESAGNVLTSTNPYGLTTSSQYDGWNRILAESDYLNNVTKYLYSRDNQYGVKTEVQAPDGSKTREYTNAFGWTTKSEALSLNKKWIKKEFQYDIAGKTLRESEPSFGTPNQWNNTGYDKYGRPTSQRLYTGKTITTEYNGLSVTVDDGTKTITTTKDAMGNIVKLKDPGGTINYTYFANGTMKSANYGDHAVTTKIDEWGRKKELNDPSAGKYTYEYNILGETTKETTPKGYTEYQYDAVGKVTRKKVSGDQTDLALNYVYDNITKLLMSMSGVDAVNNNNYAYTYAYDRYKRPQSVSENMGAAKFSKRWTYDNLGRQQTEEIGSQIINGASSTVQTSYVYGSSGALREVKNGDQTLWKLESSDHREQPTLISLGNGQKKKTTYDAYGMIRRLLHEKSGGATALDIAYTFDAKRGLLLSRGRMLNRSSQTKRAQLNNGSSSLPNFDDHCQDRLSAFGGSYNGNDNCTGLLPNPCDSNAPWYNPLFCENNGGNGNSDDNQDTTDDNVDLSRYDYREHFTYDDLSRLTGVSGATSQTQEYEADGRISENSSLGTYNYDPAKRYRLATMDLNEKGQAYYGQHTKQEITYNAFKKPVEVHEKRHGRVSFQYGPLMGRSHAYYGGEQEDKMQRRYRKYYSSIVPVEIVQDRKTGKDKIVTYVHGSQYDSPLVHIKTTDNNGSFYYLHRDYLGSILAITDAAGFLVEQRQFGAWGTVDYFSKGLQASTFNHENSLLSRGYTGHEHFFGVSLIHMNGRMYDQNLGRFLSPDNNIQEPFNTQSFNRYSLAVNNPLMYTDQDGEFFLIAAIIGAIVGAYLGGSLANQSLNPSKWDYSKASTWIGIGIGGVLGFFGGNGIAAGNISLSVNFMGATVKLSGGKLALGVIGVSILGIELWDIKTDDQYTEQFKDNQNTLDPPSPSPSAGNSSQPSDRDGSEISDFKISVPSDFSGSLMHGPGPPGEEHSLGETLNDYYKQLGNWWDNVNTAANMTYLWLNGTGAKIGTFTFENDRVANALRNSAGMDEARDLYYNKGTTEKLYDFGIIKGPFHAGLDPIEQFVGSYYWEARVVGDELEFTLTNQTSLYSGSYHTWPRKWNPETGPMGTFKQRYIFREPLRK